MTEMLEVNIMFYHEIMIMRRQVKKCYTDDKL